MLGVLGALITGVAGIAGSFINNLFGQRAQEDNSRIARENMALQREMNQQNIDFQRETNAQNEALMREGWVRDDSAYQRKVADLESAGLSKTLAVNGGAMASSPITLKAPEVQPVQNMDRKQAMLFDLMSSMQMAHSFADMVHQDKVDNMQAKMNEVQMEYIKAQTESVKNRTNESQQLFDYRLLQLLADKKTLGGAAIKYLYDLCSDFRSKYIYHEDKGYFNWRDDDKTPHPNLDNIKPMYYTFER